MRKGDGERGRGGDDISEERVEIETGRGEDKKIRKRKNKQYTV